MQKLKTPFHVAVLVAITLFWTACKKEVSNPAVENQPNETAKLMGADPIDPVEMAKIPLIMSNEFRLAQTNSVTDPTNQRGKPIKPPTTTGDQTAPTVNITSPGNGSTFTTSSVTITASASDNVGVTSVSFSVNGTTGTLTATPYSWTWNSGTAANGNYTVTVTARDAAGNASSASITIAKNVTISVPPPTTLPSSYSLSMPPVQNQGGAGACIAFAATYARDYESFKRSNAGSYSQSTNILSPAYVFNQTKSSTSCSGSALITTFNFLKSNGVCTWTSMPYVD